MDDQVSIASGGNSPYHCSTNEELLEPIGAPHEFSEPIDVVRARIVETIGQAAAPHKPTTWHPAIDRLLRDDEKRREKS
jgi:hypothetical protein